MNNAFQNLMRVAAFGFLESLLPCISTFKGSPHLDALVYNRRLLKSASLPSLALAAIKDDKMVYTCWWDQEYNALLWKWASRDARERFELDLLKLWLIEVQCGVRAFVIWELMEMISMMTKESFGYGNMWNLCFRKCLIVISWFKHAF